MSFIDGAGWCAFAFAVMFSAFFGTTCGMLLAMRLLDGKGKR